MNLVKLTDVVEIKKGKKPSSLGEKTFDRNIPYINIQAFEKGIVSEYAEIGKYVECDESDVLLVWDGARCGLSGRGVKGYVGSTLGRLRSSKLTPDYLQYFLQLNYSLLNKNNRGTGIPHINPEVLRSLEVPLLEKEEQEEVTKKINTLFEKIDSGNLELISAQEKLSKYKQSILNSAIRGKLVPQDPKDEPASKLLEKIKKEKEKLIAEKKIKKEKPLPRISEDEIPFELPENWTWAKLGDVFNVFVGSTPSRKEKKFWGGKISWVSSGEVCFQDIHKTKETITQKGLDGSSCNIHPSGTVMLGMIGEGKTRGQAGILRIEATHNQNTAAIRIGNTGCSSEYLYYYLMANYENNRKVGSGNNQKALNKDRIRNFLFPLPPLKEQHRIAEKILNCFKFVDEVESTLNNNLSLSNLLKQSILKKAFEGDL